MQACRLRSHTVDVTPLQAATKRMVGMAEQQTEWRQNGRMAEWQNGRNGGRNGRMAEWQNSGNGGRNGQMVGMVEWREWRTEWSNAEWQEWWNG